MQGLAVLMILISSAPACIAAEGSLRVALLILATDLSPLEGLWDEFFQSAASVHPPNLTKAAKAEVLEERRTRDVVSRLHAAGTVRPVEGIVNASCVDNKMLRVRYLGCLYSFACCTPLVQGGGQRRPSEPYCRLARTITQFTQFRPWLANRWGTLEKITTYLSPLVFGYY
jgi:hypothetical protein